MLAMLLVIRRGARRFGVAACAAVAMLAATSAHAVEDYKVNELVERARVTLESFNSDQDLQQFRAYVPYAHALLIIPSYVRGAFWLGIATGMGVVIKRDEATGQWSSPAFYSLRDVSIGAQFGGSGSEMIVIFQTPGSVDLLNRTSVQFGIDAAAAAGNLGYGVEGATQTNMSADIAAFARSKGAFMGASVSGSTLVVKHDWNTVYYGRNVAPMDILNGQVSNPAADGLRRAAEKFFRDNSGR